MKKYIIANTEGRGYVFAEYKTKLSMGRIKFFNELTILKYNGDVIISGDSACYGFDDSIMWRPSITITPQSEVWFPETFEAGNLIWEVNCG